VLIRSQLLLLHMSLVVYTVSCFDGINENDEIWFVVSIKRNSLQCYLLLYHINQHDKRNDLNFPIMNIPFICSNIPATLAYGVYICQLIRYSRACGSYQYFLGRWLLITRKLLIHQIVAVATMIWLTVVEYPWSFVTQIFHNCQPNHCGDRNAFDVMIST
jgi:hypothetical protein